MAARKAQSTLKVSSIYEYQNLNVFYVFPVEVFVAYGSTVTLVETGKRQRKPKSAAYREAFELISKWAVPKETLSRNLSNSGKPPGGGNPEPSPLYFSGKV